MDPFSSLSTSSLSVHSLEIYTASLNIQGNATGPFRRSSDLVMVNKEHIQAMYIIPPSTTTEPLQNPPSSGTSPL